MTTRNPISESVLRPDGRDTLLTDQPQVSRGRGSIRKMLLLLGLLPAVITGAVLTTYTVIEQPRAQRDLILNGAEYAGRSFSGRVDDLLENLGQSLQYPEVRSTLQTRTEDLVATNQSGTLPITDALITDTLGSIVIAHNKDYAPGSSSVDPNLTNKWIDQNPALAKLITATAVLAQTSDKQATNHFVRNGVSLLISAVPFTTHIGTSVLVLNEGIINQSTQLSVRNNLLLTAAILLLSMLLATLIAQRISRRIRYLNTATQRITNAQSIGELEESIRPSGNDELTTLAENLDLLRETTRIMVQQAE